MDQPAATSVLCEKCRGLCENGTGWCWAQHPTGEEYPSIYLHYPNLYALRAKVVEGCTLCSIIFRSLVDFCKFDIESLKDDMKRTRRDFQETQADIKRIVSRVQDTGILQPDPPDSQRKRTHTFHAAFDQERLERLQSIFGRERLLIKSRTLVPRDVGVKLPDSLSVVWLGSMKTCVSRSSTGPKSIRLLVGHDDPLGSFSQPGGIRPESSLLSDTHLRRISSWRKVCAQEHEGCPNWQESRELPTRVIAVNSNDPRYVKLVNTHRGRTAVYACLSYSWGTGTQHCTTTRNIKGHLQRILISDLPGTVADAIKLCRALQIPYLWIDALCIIQDDKDDWSREAAAMARIYGSSVLTISVPNTSDCTENFLTRSLDKYANVEVDWIHGPSGTAGTAKLVYDWPRDHSSLLSKSPWMERGWTFQEWVLSPCVLHCGSTMTVYECLHGTCYESHADGIEQPFKSLTLGHGINSDASTTRSMPQPVHADTWPQDANTTKEKNSAVEIANMSRLFERVKRIRHDLMDSEAHAPGPSWSDVVTQFCGRRLTKDTDKLPALAGLAVRFQSYKSATIAQEQKYEYLAGLWWDGSLMSHSSSEAAELPTGLLWRRAGDEFLSKPTAYRAPSWSWAALDGPIEFLDICLPEPGASKLQILDALCIYDYSDSLSSVKTGWIDAMGLLRRAWPVKVRDNIDLSTSEGDEQGGEPCEDKWCVRFDEKLSASRWKEMQRFQIFLLFVATSCSPGTPRVTHHALVLKRVAAERACLFDCFSRLGTALKNTVSQDDYTESRYENAEHEKETVFQGWDCKKMRLL